jgi:hypothetical protein
MRALKAAILYVYIHACFKLLNLGLCLLKQKFRWLRAKGRDQAPAPTVHLTLVFKAAPAIIHTTCSELIAQFA